MTDDQSRAGGPGAKPIARWVMREALCLSFYGTHWNDTSAFRRDICDQMARDTLAALAEVKLCVTEVSDGR